MINIFKSAGATLNKVDEISRDVWIDMINPSVAEIDTVAEKTNIDRDLLLKMLDENELPRIEKDDNATLIVVDVPLRDADANNEYLTYPLGVIISDKNYVVTISGKSSGILTNFRRGNVKNFESAKKTRFLIQILTKAAAEYLKILNMVYKDIGKKEDKLGKSTSNSDLLDLLATEKTLVYFTTSLQENVLVLEKLASGTAVKLYPEDADLLEDALIENRQAVDMATIYRDILSSITGTYASVVSNNLNDVMKFFAGITIVLSIPTMISSFLGMNVPLGSLETDQFAWLKILILSVIASALAYLWMRKKGHL